MRVFSNTHKYTKTILIMTAMLSILKMYGFVEMSWYEATCLIWIPLCIISAIILGFIIIIGLTIGILYIQSKYSNND
jgi:hypothetical protein